MHDNYLHFGIAGNVSWNKYSSVPLLKSISSLFFTNIPILTPITSFNQNLAIVATSNTQKYHPITILVSYTTTHITQPQKLVHEGRIVKNNIRRPQLIPQPIWELTLPDMLKTQVEHGSRHNFEKHNKDRLVGLSYHVKKWSLA